MNAAPVIKGWCPGALTPMESGDGLVVRIRPFNGHLTSAQADGIANLARAHGNGMLDLSSRANIQIRGVTPHSLPALTAGLDDLSLLDPTPEAEARRNVIVTPFWDHDDETQSLASALSTALSASDAPAIPSKFGFAVDTGPKPVLQSAPADIRLERAADGTLLLVAETASVGKPVTIQTAISEAISLAHWFLKTRETQTRMAKLLADCAGLPTGHIVPRQSSRGTPAPGITPQGALVGIAFGQLRADTLAALAEHGALRLTAWRMVLVEASGELPDIEGLITDPDDPLLHITACTGAPGCTQAHIETRTLARALAPQLHRGQTLHVSGCAKGCAHPKAAEITITGTFNGLNLIQNGRASDTPVKSGLSAEQLIKAI